MRYIWWESRNPANFRHLISLIENLQTWVEATFHASKLEQSTVLAAAFCFLTVALWLNHCFWIIRWLMRPGYYLPWNLLPKSSHLNFAPFQIFHLFIFAIFYFAKHILVLSSLSFVLIRIAHRFQWKKKQQQKSSSRTRLMIPTEDAPIFITSSGCASCKTYKIIYWISHYQIRIPSFQTKHSKFPHFEAYSSAFVPTENRLLLPSNKLKRRRLLSKCAPWI